MKVFLQVRRGEDPTDDRRARQSRVSARHKAEIAERANRCCEYCRSQEPFSPDPFVVEHILPRSRGGSDDLSNLAFACQGCNGHKHVSTKAPDPLTGRLVSLFHPRRDEWDRNFAWSACASSGRG